MIRHYTRKLRAPHSRRIGPPCQSGRPRGGVDWHASGPAAGSGTVRHLQAARTGSCAPCMLIGGAERCAALDHKSVCIQAWGLVTANLGATQLRHYMQGARKAHRSGQSYASSAYSSGLRIGAACHGSAFSDAIQSRRRRRGRQCDGSHACAHAATHVVKAGARPMQSAGLH